MNTEPNEDNILLGIVAAKYADLLKKYESDVDCAFHAGWEARDKAGPGEVAMPRLSKFAAAKKFKEARK